MPELRTLPFRFHPRPPLQIEYAFVDGYLIVASSREALTSAIQMHRDGESLAKSKNFLASLPPGHDSGVSALLYQDPIAMTAVRLQQVAPGLAQYFAKSGGEIKPGVICVYGEERSIREANASGSLDIPAVLVGAAIAIPNLLRAKIAANEASAAGSIRTIVTAQVTYASLYPERGFAPDLATLGPDPNNRRVARQSGLYCRRSVHKIWIPLQAHASLQAKILRRVCRGRCSCRAQQRNAKLLRYLRWHHPIQTRR
jgi:hypothetical protein